MKTETSQDGTSIAYDVTGEGPTLIYITGATCFRKFFPIKRDVKGFSRAFTVYNYDRRGRGDSTDTPPYAIEREVEDLEALIGAAEAPVSLYGHSSGAALALEAALTIPDKLHQVVLYDPSYVNSEAEKASYAELSRKVLAQLDEGRNKEAMKTFLKGIGMPAPFVKLLPLLPGWKTMTALAPTLRYDIELTKELPPVERVAHVSLPVKILVGEKSPEGVQDSARQLADAIPGADLERIPGQDHMVSGKALLPHLTAFLKE